jgi:ribosomal protein L30E
VKIGEFVIGTVYTVRRVIKIVIKAGKCVLKPKIRIKLTIFKKMKIIIIPGKRTLCFTGKIYRPLEHTP